MIDDKKELEGDLTSRRWSDTTMSPPSEATLVYNGSDADTQVYNGSDADTEATLEFNASTGPAGPFQAAGFPMPRYAPARPLGDPLANM